MRRGEGQPMRSAGPSSLLADGRLAGREAGGTGWPSPGRLVAKGSSPAAAPTARGDRHTGFGPVPHLDLRRMRPSTRKNLVEVSPHPKATPRKSGGVNDVAQAWTHGERRPSCDRAPADRDR